MRAWLLRHRLRVMVHRIRCPGTPMFSDNAARDLLGKRVIVGITRRAHDGRLLGLEQRHGRIVRASLSEGIVLQAPSGEELKLPPDLRAFFGARRGDYRFRSSGEVVVDPDLRTSWTHTLARDEPQPDEHGDPEAQIRG